MADIFSEWRDELLFLMTDSPPMSCNYRCPYCFWNKDTQAGPGFLPHNADYDQWVATLDAAVAKIQRPLMLSIGPRGEALVIPKWWGVLRRMTAFDKVHSVAFLSNLSRPMAPLLNGIDIRKLGITATLHPSQFRDPAEDLRRFIDQVSWLKDNGARVVVNYVLTPDQISAFAGYRETFTALGITMTANLFRGRWNGQVYPEAFTREQLVQIREYLNDVPFIYEYQSHELSPLGNFCTAGRHLIYLEADGSVFNCNFARERLGSVHDASLNIFDGNMPCSATQCECKWTIPLQEHLVRNYVGVGNIHEFRRRPHGATGTHPFY